MGRSVINRSLPLVMVFTAALASAAPPAASEGSALVAVELDGQTLDLRRADGLEMRISFLADDLLRVQATADGVFRDEGSKMAPIVLPRPPAAVSVTTATDGEAHRFATSRLTLIVHPDPLLLELHRAGDGAPLWRELKPLELGETTTQTLDSDPAEHFYGGGQQNGSFEFNGRLLPISYSGGWEEGDRPSPAPFYMSDRGYGVLRNTWSDGEYDFRSDGYLGATHAETRFDAYYMVGDSIRRVLDLYTRLTGRAALLPRWAFGYGDADCYNDGDNVAKPGTTPAGWSDGPTGTTPDVVASVAARYREHRMPGAWILPNDGYGCGYSELPEVVRRLGQLGFATGLWTEDGVDRIAWEIGNAGSRVQKLDVAWTGQGYQWAFDANHQAAQGFLEHSDARPFIWTVMGWAGIQRYAVTWTGDQSGSWDFIRWHVPTLIGSGLSGMNYSTGDVDGIFGGSPETFTRDLQWKCFTPVLMGMSGWSKVERKHPWWFAEPHRSINRRYLLLRQRLMPYLYTLAHETATTGAPMVRGIMWDHPDDPDAAAHPDQFLLGPELLVAPVYRSQAASGGFRRDVYLPEGRWIDYWTGIVVDAGPEGRLIDVPVDLATLPVLVRAGAIIPMAPESLYDGEVPTDPLTLDLYPHGESELVLYADDGRTRAYLDGAFSRQRIAMNAAGERIEVQVDGAVGSFEGMFETRRLVLELHTRRPPRAVLLDDQMLPELTAGTAVAEADRGWTFDAADRFGVVRVATGRLDCRATHRVVVELDPKVEPAPTGGFPAAPGGNGAVDTDALLVVGRPAEEPGHHLENAFDGNPDTWFRTLRDQSVAYGPHELTLSLGGRRLVEGFRVSPRNDKHWKYGQVRDWELHLAEVNGEWGEAVASGTLEQTSEMQEVRFPAQAGRLLRLRVLSTHDDGVDPMVLGAVAAAGGAYDALAPVRVSPVTISELQILERPTPTTARAVAALAAGAGAVSVNGLSFAAGIRVRGDSRRDFELAGDWHSFRAEVGIDDSSAAHGPGRFQVWGDDGLLWDSGPLTDATVAKPRLDIRGVRLLSLRTVAVGQDTGLVWAEPQLVGFAGDVVTPVEMPPGA